MSPKHKSGSNISEQNISQQFQQGINIDDFTNQFTDYYKNQKIQQANNNKSALEKLQQLEKQVLKHIDPFGFRNNQRCHNQKKIKSKQDEKNSSQQIIIAQEFINKTFKNPKFGKNLPNSENNFLVDSKEYLTNDQQRFLQDFLKLQTEQEKKCQLDKMRVQITSKEKNRLDNQPQSEYIKIVWLDPSPQNNSLLCENFHEKYPGLQIIQFTEYSKLQRELLQSKNNIYYFLIFSNSAATDLLKDNGYYPFANIIAEFIYCGNIDVAHKICTKYGLAQIQIANLPRQLFDFVEKKITHFTEKGYKIGP